jgi:hypothetical protein
MDGESYHDAEHDRCCPDFSCCEAEALWDADTRALYWWAYRVGRRDVMRALQAGATVEMWRRRGYNQLLGRIPSGQN